MIKYLIQLNARPNGEPVFLCKGEWAAYNTSPFFSNAVYFETIEEAQSVLAEYVTTPTKSSNHVYTDGSVNPPDIVWSAIRLSDDRSKHYFYASIVEVSFSVTASHLVKWDGSGVTSSPTASVVFNEQILM